MIFNRLSNYIEITVWDLKYNDQYTSSKYDYK
jgi:hypothetical protein